VFEESRGACLEPVRALRQMRIDAGAAMEEKLAWRDR
jgi:hypothetical protein